MMMRTLPLVLALVLTACSGRADPDASRESADPAAAAAAPAARAAIYEVFVRDFSPAGNFQGVIAGLDRIQGAGANVLWLMPIHPVGKLHRKEPLGSSYSLTDYRAVNPDYGTAADFRALVAAVHARGMRLIIDWVPNHTAWDHVWLQEHPEFYTRDSTGAVSVPRNNEGQLTDWTDVADLDYGNRALWQAMISAMEYWLDEFGIDGFRVDVAGMVPDDFWREAIPRLRQGRRILLLAEWGEPKMHELGFDLTYAWDPYHRLKAVWKGEPADTFVDVALAELRGLPRGARRIRFTTNHDETAWDAPPVTLFGGSAGARAAYAATVLLPGVPLLYNGQEVESPQQLGLFEKEPIDWNRPGADTARAFYRRVVELAREQPALAGDEVQPVGTSAPQDAIAYLRGGRVLVLVNARNRPVTVSVEGRSVDGARDLLSGVVQQGEMVRLGAYQPVVLELRK